jgi:hypothetical protein
MEIPEKAICLAICGTIGYCVYVAVTRADGVVFGAFCAFLGTIGGYAWANRSSESQP